MSNFSVPVTKILSIDPIPGADAIELATVFGFQSVVKKGQFGVGDLVVYIPEAAIVPDWLLKQLGLEGKLAGSNKNRVKAIKLRGCVSQGILYPVERTGSDLMVVGDNSEGCDNHAMVNEGTDVAEFLGIKKYEPPIPTSLGGEVTNIFGHTVKYDIENIQRYPDVLEIGEEIIITEKLHGTFCCLAYDPTLNHAELIGVETGGSIFAYSKGLGAQGLVFKNNEKNKNNVYHKTLVKYQENLIDLHQHMGLDYTTPLFVMGEVFGQGVQDLTYGIVTPEFRVFDLYVGKPGSGGFVNWLQIQNNVRDAGFQTVPELFIGKLESDVIQTLRDGKDTISGTHIREGVVIKPAVERNHLTLGRVILKSVSPDYLTRKGNTTEFN